MAKRAAPPVEPEDTCPRRAPPGADAAYIRALVERIIANVVVRVDASVDPE